MNSYSELIVTNYHTLPYFKSNFRLAVDINLIEALTALNGGKFLIIGYFNDIPVIAYKTWHDDDHFLIYMTDAIVSDENIVSEKIGPDVNWDEYLVLH